MADEKQFTLNVRKDILKKPLYKRAKKAISSIREQTGKAMHVKPENVKICKELNELVMSQGKHNPPTKYKLHAVMIDDFALVELQGVEFPQKKEKKALDAKGLKEKIQEKLAGKEDIKKKEAQSKETEKDKELAKEELALEKKEHHHEHPGAPDKYKTEEQNKMDKMKGIVAWDRKKDIGEK